MAHYRIVTPGYLEAMRIPVVAGRTFADTDTADRPLAVIVNQTLKRLAWGDRDAVGQRITFGGQLASSHLWAEVVGVVGDVRHFGPGIPPVPEIYWASAQIDAAPGETLRRMRRNSTLVVAATSGDALALVPAVRAAVRAIDPDQPIANVRTMSSLMSTALYLSRASTWLLSLFGAAALTFALLGVFGASAYAVAQRRRELAIRLALGAVPRRLPWMVVRNALDAGAAGIVVGISLSAVLRRAVDSLLVGVDGGLSATLAAVSATLLISTAAACWLAARRAAAIDPMRILRME
jgi:hypothetical protein